MKYLWFFAAGFILGNVWFAFVDWVLKKLSIVVTIGEEKEQVKTSELQDPKNL
jgi:hypothetical protein